MSIISQINRINNNISSAYTELINKEAIIPEDQNSFNLKDTINSIPYYPFVKCNDVNFYDYDGTLLYSYSASEFSQLESLPSQPIHDGLTSMGWNFTLSEILSYISKYGECNVGAMYNVTDNSTKLFITLSSSNFLSPTLYFKLYKGTLTIDWGDNSTSDIITEESTAYVDHNQSHTYTKTGNYIISLTYVGNASNIFLGQDLNFGLFGDFSMISTSNFPYVNCLSKIYIGKKIYLWDYALTNAKSLKALLFSYNNSATIIKPYTCQNCTDLEYIILPPTITTLNNYSFYQSGLQKIIASPALLALGTYNFSQSNLKKILFPFVSQFKNIATSSFSNCYSIVQVKIPNNVTTIRTGSFANCYNLTEIDLTDYTDSSTLPTLQNVNAFSNTNLSKIWVKNDSMKEAFQAASNWANFSTLFDIKTA